MLVLGLEYPTFRMATSQRCNQIVVFSVQSSLSYLNNFVLKVLYCPGMSEIVRITEVVVRSRLAELITFQLLLNSPNVFDRSHYTSHKNKNQTKYSNR